MVAKETLTDTMTGAAPPASCAQGASRRRSWPQSRAKAAVPAAESRIDTAAALARGRGGAAGGGTDGPGGQPDGRGPVYVVNGQCPCPDFPTAPGHLCTHRLAYGIAKRPRSCSRRPQRPCLHPATRGVGTGSDALDDLSAEAVEADPGDTGLPPEQSATATLPQETALPAQYLAADRRQALREVCGPADDGACPGLTAARSLVYRGE